MNDQQPDPPPYEATQPPSMPPPPMPPPAPAYGVQPYTGGDAPDLPAGPVGKVRDTVACMLLCLVTLGIYSVYWFFKVHEEMQQHTRGRGIGGLVALLLALFVGIVMPYITSSEVGDLYERQGREKPVSAATGLWYFPGIFILIGPFVWFIKTNGALNDYWRSQGAAS